MPDQMGQFLCALRFFALILPPILPPLLISGLDIRASAVAIGINYGQMANNLPSPARALELVKSLGATTVKLYDANPAVLAASADSSIEFIVGVGNEYIQNMTNISEAKLWLATYVQPYIQRTNITCITVGNEVLSGDDESLMSNLLQAMQSLHSALVSLKLDGQIKVSTAHSASILSNSYPPSYGSFKTNLMGFIKPLLIFLAQTHSPFLVNAYPFFAYKGDPSHVSLAYALNETSTGMKDPITKLTYYNMLDAQIDSFYSAVEAVNFTNIEIIVSETGWPSKGDPEETGANITNAKTYNGNLFNRASSNLGTPMHPGNPIQIYVFALFNENMKPGPTSERNYGLFYPDGTPVYDIRNNGYSPAFPPFFIDYSNAVRSHCQCAFYHYMASLILVVILCNFHVLSF